MTTLKYFMKKYPKNVSHHSFKLGGGGGLNLHYSILVVKPWIYLQYKQASLQEDGRCKQWPAQKASLHVWYSYLPCSKIIGNCSAGTSLLLHAWEEKLHRYPAHWLQSLCNHCRSFCAKFITFYLILGVRWVLITGLKLSLVYVRAFTICLK